MKNNRAPGKDLIAAELIKHGGSMLRRRIHRLIEEVWETEQMPQEWSTALICPIHKKGNKLECSNYQGISFLNVT
jgi:hypothetical protein